jgi:hypothetical protein
MKLEGLILEEGGKEGEREKGKEERRKYLS